MIAKPQAREIINRLFDNITVFFLDIEYRSCLDYERYNMKPGVFHRIIRLPESIILDIIDINE